MQLVYGGGNIGLMGAVADAVLHSGGKVVGFIPQALADKELAHYGVTELCIVGSMHERKAGMADRADAFIALPGGFGTLDEFCEVLTWGQLGFHAKPCGLLNCEGYFDPLLAFFDRAADDRFLQPEHRTMILTSDDPAALLDQMADYRATVVQKWIDREQT
jgi:uncharacterized protein (TIGR00730 family)